MTATTPQQPTLKNHWWWRPGWAVGRRYYAWHLTFAGAEPVLGLASRVQSRLAGLDGVEPVPPRWLHLTMQGVGFTSEVSAGDVAAITAAATARLCALAPFDLTFGPVRAGSEGTWLEVTPAAPVAAVRDAIRAGIADVLAEVPGSAAGFWPHVSVAYHCSDEAPAAPLHDRVEALRGIEPVTIPVRSAQLIEMHRDERMYVWEVVADLPFAGA